MVLSTAKSTAILGPQTAVIASLAKKEPGFCRSGSSPVHVANRPRWEGWVRAEAMSLSPSREGVGTDGDSCKQPSSSHPQIPK